MPTSPFIESSGSENQWEKCSSYIVSQLRAPTRPAIIHGRPASGPAVTISHQTGSGAHEIAERLAGLLQAAEPSRAAPWTVFDRQLVEKVLEEHQLPRSLARLLREEHRSYLRDLTEEYLGLRPPSWVVVPQIAETVLHLADAGHVILVGRGASLITARLPKVFHVRLVASLPRRVARVQELNQLTPKEAEKLVTSTDRGRGRYVSTHFHQRVDDDLLYHLVINTDLVPYPDAAQLIADGARRCFGRSAGGETPEQP